MADTGVKAKMKTKTKHYIGFIADGLIKTKCGYYTNDYERVTATYTEVTCRRCKR